MNENMNNLENQEISLEELQGLSEQEEMFPVIELTFEDFDSKEFNKGIKDASYISGFFTALKNSGMYSADIVSILLNNLTIEHNLKTAQINKDMNIEMSKNQVMINEKNSL